MPDSFLYEKGSKSSMKTKKASTGGKITSKSMDVLPKPGTKPIKVKKATTKIKKNGVKSKSAKGTYRD